MKKIGIIFILLIISNSIFADLIISQYIETNSGSHPKGLELWNSGQSTIDFSTHNLTIERGSNGASPSTVYTLSSGTLASGDVIVCGSDQDGEALYDYVEDNYPAVSYYYDNDINHNGNDSYVIKLGGVIQDVFGNPGNDPGSAWSGNGVSTANQNIGLKTGINTGDTDGWTDPSTRFETISSNPAGTGGCNGFGVEDNQTLPVTLSSFTAQYLNSKPTLYWLTQSENDNMGWFIYRNTEENFTAAHKISDMIPGHGTTTQPQSYLYEDLEQLQVEQTYYYWLESLDYSGTIHHFDRVAQITIPHPDDPGQQVTPPTAYNISADPSPFSQNTTISFVLSQTGMVDVAIYNVKGELIKSYASVMATADEKVEFEWNGKNDAGKTLSNGVYLYSIKVNGKDYATRRMILMK